MNDAVPVGRVERPGDLLDEPDRPGRGPAPVLQGIPEAAVSQPAHDEEGQTLILDFGELGGQGLFDLFGVPSAHFDTGRTIPAGADVAQVNWDGGRARIDWVPVRESRTEDGVSILVLPNELLRGASGGGIFYNGRHVANNWSTSRVEGAVTGSVIDSYSVAAVNGGIVAQMAADEPVG